MLNSALGQAVKWQLLPKNLAVGVELPARQRDEMRALHMQDNAARRFEDWLSEAPGTPERGTKLGGTP